MTRTYTRGPWNVAFIEGNTLITGNGMTLCKLAHDCNQTKENALLIAAAPELLSALIEMVANKEDGSCFHEDEHGAGSALWNARAAIAKALGE